jgi:hypothetical protein
LFKRIKYKGEKYIFQMLKILNTSVNAVVTHSAAENLETSATEALSGHLKQWGRGGGGHKHPHSRNPIPKIKFGQCGFAQHAIITLASHRIVEKS